MTLNLPIELPEDFTFGNCDECPLSYREYVELDEEYDFFTNCVLDKGYCPLRYINGTSCDVMYYPQVDGITPTVCEAVKENV